MNSMSPDTLSLGTLLPLSKMAEIAANERLTYANAQPFPHIVLDNFLEPTLVDRVLEEFPKPGAIKWTQFDNGQEIKLASSAESSFGSATRLLLYHLNSITFLNFLSELTGIEDLIPDPGFDGGGLHQIERGGKLGIHADFNKHPRYGLDRRLNVLLYLNKNWREDYGGALELWDRKMAGCVQRILPLFNRVVIFSTTDFTYHGHPDPLQCPPGMSRKSLALYYFSNGRPAEEVSGSHKTLFKARFPADFRSTAGQRLQRLRNIASDFLPPIVARQIRKSAALLRNSPPRG